MQRIAATAAFLTAAFLLALASPAGAQDAVRPDAALVQRYLQSTFGKAAPEWQAKLKPDDTIAACNAARGAPDSKTARAIEAREAARVTLPGDGVYLGDWKAGAKIANEGRGGQFSDPPGTVSGGNCYACHQLDPAELSYGTLGPSLKGFGRERRYEAEAAKAAFIKIFDSQAVVACSNMPRFGVNGVLSEQQIKDLVAYLFDTASPVNK